MTDHGQLFLPDRSSFAQGATSFRDHDPTPNGSGVKIFVPVLLENLPFQLLVEIDTGGYYMILNRELSEQLAPHLAEPTISGINVSTTVGHIKGDLYRHGVTLLATDGEDLNFEALVLVTDDWHRSENILGYSGGLQFFRFAIDPNNNRFFFGRLE